MGAIASFRPEKRPGDRTRFRIVIRVLVWLVIGVLATMTFCLHEIFAQAKPLGRRYDSAFSNKWVSFRLLNPEVQELARVNHLGDQPGYTEELIARFFLEEDVRIELALQPHQQQGLTSSTGAAEFACMVWGRDYEKALQRFEKSGRISNKRYFELVNESKRLSIGKTFWNSPDAINSRGDGSDISAQLGRGAAF